MTQPLSLLPAASAPSNYNSELALTLLGPSTAMAQLWAQLRRLAPHVRTVLLSGEPDCGQEAVAHVLLDLSPLPHRSFVRISAADADDRLGRPSGLHLLAADAFVFVPDLHRFSPAAQDGLLRLLRGRRSRPLTVVASTTEDLRSLVSTGTFSAELAEAFSSIRLTVPSLKQRPEDLPMLLSQLLLQRAQTSGEPAPHLTEDFLRAAMQHPWPGNLSELSRTAASLLSASVGCAELRATDLHRALAQHATRTIDPSAAARMVSLDTVLREHIFAVLRACRGNKLRAAEVLGISRSTLYRMLDAAAQNAPLSIAS